MKKKTRCVLFLLPALLALGSAPVSAQQTAEAQFREEFYMSEVDKNEGLPQAVRVGGVVFVSATSAAGKDFETQMKISYMRIQSVLASYGLTMDSVAHERVYALDLGAFEKALPARRLFYPGTRSPATTWVEVSKLPGEGRLVAIEVMAVADPEEE